MLLRAQLIRMGMIESVTREIMDPWNLLFGPLMSRTIPGQEFSDDCEVKLLSPGHSRLFYYR